MRRRTFISALSACLIAQRDMALAQASDRPVVGFLYAGVANAEEATPYVSAFRQGLAEMGFSVGQNVALEYRWPRNDGEHARSFVTELANRNVAVIVGNTPPAMAAKSASSNIPIVFVTGADPVRLGLVASANRPGGNATGVSFLTVALEAKRFGLLRDLLPQAKAIVTLTDPSTPNNAIRLREVQQAASALGFDVHIVDASNESQLEAAFVTIAQRRPDALVVVPTAFFTGQRKRIVDLAARHSIPTLYGFRDFPEIGGLMSYGASLADAFRQAGSYTGRILKGEKPADLPVVYPSKFEMIINLRTAKTLGLTFPPSVLALADAVVE
jgi:ABC-type uncharacterized transport system substrate-binding protein